MGKARIFIDMDGTLAEWHSQATYEDLFEKGYFESLEEVPSIVCAAEVLLEDEDIEVFILSAYLEESRYALLEKGAWLDWFLPGIDKEHRLFVPTGTPKAGAVPGGTGKSDILLDDYTVNLREWEAGGGTGVKVFNGINGNNGTWNGLGISSSMPGRVIAQSLKCFLKGVDASE